MTRLLVSVRNSSEAQAALNGGAALIDVKEPLRGALGAADLSTINGILRVVDGRAPVSAALGELLQEMPPPGDLSGELSFVKVGLSGCGTIRDWPARWRSLVESLPPSTRPVAVVYADATSLAPREELVFRAAIELGCAALLVDTFDKSRGDLLSHWSLDRLAGLIQNCEAAGLITVVAGSLRAESIRRVLPLNPAYVAVRGAVCDGSRTATVRGELVAQLVETLRTPSAA
jgi:uncharacterized protein (UPF0264 family)